MLGDVAEVREDKNRKLYYVGAAGIISPKTVQGQKWLRDNANFAGQVDVELDEREPTAKTGSLLDEFLGWGSK
ncbi:hypothetical protein FORC73_3087 [Vibrio cholerae]|nr:hypothetical protein FORC73_3087 [Vibrio cholerae]